MRGPLDAPLVARLAATLAGGVAVLLLSGCVGLPGEGPVVEAQPRVEADGDRAIAIDPIPPKPGASAAEIVTGFLDAMTADPIRTDVAKQFLSAAGRSSWDPERATITYADSLLPQGGTTSVTVRLIGADLRDDRGAWQGSLAPQGQTLVFPMTLDEEGEYRIGAAPDALIVPETWFEQRFRPVSLYFFDRSARILVPEPVYLQSAEQLATELVKGLLLGPAPGLERVAQSFLPPDLGVGLSVPISDDGVADISLEGEATEQSPENIELMLAQLAWTLRQVPEIDTFRLTIGDRLVQLPGGLSEFSVDDGVLYDPSGYESSPLLFGLLDGRMVSGPPEALTPSNGPFGQENYRLRAIAVDLDAATVAGVTEDGTTLLQAPASSTGLLGSDEVTTVMSGATDLLRPAWDHADRLWLMDRTSGGVRVSYVEDGAIKELAAPGITGRDVRAFLVSRDGTRLVALINEPGADVLVAVRIEYDDRGLVRAASRPQVLSVAEGEQIQLKDIAWNSPTTVAYLQPVSQELFVVGTIAVDGGPTSLDGLPTNVTGRIRSLAGSPVASESLYAVAGGGGGSGPRLSDLITGSEPLDPGTSSIVYVG